MTPETHSPETMVLLIGAALAVQKSSASRHHGNRGADCDELYAGHARWSARSRGNLVHRCHDLLLASNQASRDEGRSGNWKSGPNALWGRDPQPQTLGIEMMLPTLMQ